MIKSEIAERIAETVGMSKAEASKITNALIELIKDRLSNGEPVSVMNFGKFEVKERDSRPGRNPQTGDVIQLPAQRVVKFRAAKHLRGVVKNGKHGKKGSS